MPHTIPTPSAADSYEFALPGGYQLRPARPEDVPHIVGLIRELAEFERLGHLVETTAEGLHPHLFGPRPVAECWVVTGPVEATAAQPPASAHAAHSQAPAAGRAAQPVAFALVFATFSTFRCRPGMWLEDLYVQPAHRGHGLGQALLRHVAAQAQARGCGRLEWSVLDWNANAIALYRKMGATLLPDWRICRVAGDALAQMAGACPPGDTPPALAGGPR